MLHTHTGRTRRVAALAVGAVLTAAALAAAPAAGQAPDLSTPARPAVDVVPLTAELHITRTAPDGTVDQETRHFYRDSDGRTRTETGTLITVEDPTTGTVIRMDPATQTYQRVDRDRARADAAPADRSPELVGGQRLASEPQLLGRATIEGLRSEGRSYVVTAPAREGLSGGSYEVTRWLSADVQLPVVTRVAYPDGTVYEERYTDIRVGVEPAETLFRVPAGYQEAAPTATPAQIFCPVAWTDLVIITSVGPFLGGGIVTALTSDDLGCAFVADAVLLEYPMDGIPLWPLGLPVDEWFIFDTGGPVPFLPYTAFGFVGFVAQSPTDDLTSVEALVILDIF